jgi:hemerythrin-like domain-containing protein
MNQGLSKGRREFLRKAGTIAGGSGLALYLSPASGLAARAAGPEEEEEVTPTEDLMREHGVLNRVLLIYEEGLRRLSSDRKMPPEVLASSAEIIRKFIEDYHEKNEENYLFPRFEKAGKLVDLVKVLRAQHAAGRQLTSTIERLSTLSAFKNPPDRRKLQDAIQAFIRMYRPHEAREDTVLFPALRSIVSPHEYASMGEEFEKKEHELFGEDGFEAMVDKVAGLEKTLGTYNLAHFTPKTA